MQALGLPVSLFCYLCFANPGNKNWQDVPISSSRKVKVKKKGRDETSSVRTDSSELQGCSGCSLTNKRKAALCFTFQVLIFIFLN